MGLLRMGFIANFLSHPVISGFITASGILIAASQLEYVLGVKIGGETFYEIIVELGLHAGETNLYALAIGSGVIAFLYFVRLRLKSLLISGGLGLPDMPQFQFDLIDAEAIIAYLKSLER